MAVDKEIIRVNPCEDLEYEPKPEARHRYISRDEFKKILSTPMYDKRMELARRAFIFSTLTGLAYVDIKLLHPHHIGQTVYPHQPQEDKGGGFHTLTSHSGTDIVVVQHNR